MAGHSFQDALSYAALASLVETLDEGVILQDGGLTIVAANASATRLLGLEHDALIGPPRGRLTFLHEDASVMNEAELPPSIAFHQNRLVKDSVVGVRRPDATVVWLRVSSFPVALECGKPGVATVFVDITPERISQRRLSSVLASIDDYLYAWRYHVDGSVEVTFESMPAAAFLRREADGDEEELWRDALHPDDLAQFDHRVLGCQRRAEDGEFDYRIVTPGGEVRWLHERWRARRLDDGSTLGEGIVSDITLRRRIEAEAERLARTDALTGAANRREFGQRLAEILATSGQAVSIVLLDIDHFKAINDSFGHHAGDDVLIEVANRLFAAIRPDDLLARWGGEEFALCLAGVVDADTAHIRCEELRHALADDPISITAGELPITASFGAAIAMSGDEPDAVIDLADAALYHAKRRGRNQTRLAGELMMRDDLDADLPDSVHVARALALAASVHEGAQSLHTEQVGDLAARIAQVLGESPISVLRCRLGGLLHDVGKVAIPDAILGKPGPLTDDEMVIMRSHSAIGAEIVRRISSLASAEEAVRFHHERWDGSGYPDGLAGEAIPLDARIVAAADAFSAMTSDRIYRNAREHGDALRELRASAGSHLDPAIVDALIRALMNDQDLMRRHLGRADHAA